MDVQERYGRSKLSWTAPVDTSKLWRETGTVMKRLAYWLGQTLAALFLLWVFAVMNLSRFL
jgi:hypothetical protein